MLLSTEKTMIHRNQHSQQELSLILLLAISVLFLLVALGQGFIGTEAAHLGYIKLAKFSASLAIYATTMLWLLKQISGGGRLLDWAATAAFAGAMLELTSLLIQAAYHGWQTSLLVAIGRLAILLPTALIVIVFRMLLRESIAPALRLALLWATGLALFGCLPGVLMLFEMSTQDAAVDSLRLAHFVGLHTLQLMPLAYFVVAKRSPSIKRQIMAINTLGYMLLVLIAALTIGSIGAGPAQAIAAIFIALASVFLAKFLASEPRLKLVKPNTTYSGSLLSSSIKQ
jgi:hypothetical protein